MFDSIDWEIESERIGKAFGIQGEFSDGASGYLRTFANFDKTSASFFMTDDLLLRIRYDNSQMDFRISQIVEGKCLTTQLCIMWSGQIYLGVQNNWHRIQQIPIKANIVLARGLLRLKLLTPEAEDLLHLSLSGHEKLEWMLEYNI